MKERFLQWGDSKVSAAVEKLFQVALTCLFAWLLIELGDWMIGKSLSMNTTEHQGLMSRGGKILSWMGGGAVLLTLFELVLWPWYSIKAAYDQHKDDPAFAGRFAEGWCILCGLLLHAWMWSSS